MQLKLKTKNQSPGAASRTLKSENRLNKKDAPTRPGGWLVVIRWEKSRRLPEGRLYETKVTALPRWWPHGGKLAIATANNIVEYKIAYSLETGSSISQVGFNLSRRDFYRAKYASHGTAYEKYLIFKCNCLSSLWLFLYIQLARLAICFGLCWRFFGSKVFERRDCVAYGEIGTCIFIVSDMNASDVHVRELKRKKSRVETSRFTCTICPIFAPLLWVFQWNGGQRRSVRFCFPTSNAFVHKMYIRLWYVSVKWIIVETSRCSF